MTSLIDSIKRAFRTPSAEELGLQELAEAKRQLLRSETALDWAKANVQFNRDRIARLEGGAK